MTNLIKLSEINSASNFDFDTIDNKDERDLAIVITAKYDHQFNELRNEANEILKTNTVALSEMVYQLKETQSHGNFSRICQDKYGIDRNKQSALVGVGKAIAHGEVPESAFELLSACEPRAAQKFLKADEETQGNLAQRYKQSGKAPVQRDFYHRGPSPGFEANLDKTANDFPGLGEDDEVSNAVVNTEAVTIQTQPTPPPEHIVLPEPSITGKEFYNWAEKVIQQNYKAWSIEDKKYAAMVQRLIENWIHIRV
jgi:hypothetical protein